MAKKTMTKAPHGNTCGECKMPDLPKSPATAKAGGKKGY